MYLVCLMDTKLHLRFAQTIILKRMVPAHLRNKEKRNFLLPIAPMTFFHVLCPKSSDARSVDILITFPSFPSCKQYTAEMQNHNKNNIKT